MSVKPVPDGFTNITPHLIVKDAAEAIAWYGKAFGAEQISRLDGPDGKVMYAELRIGNAVILLNDEFPEMGVRGPAALGGTPVSIHMYVDDADALFAKVEQAGGIITTPLQEMFWGDRYGKLSDPYGHHWSIASRVEELSPREIRERGAKFFAQGAE